MLDLSDMYCTLYVLYCKYCMENIYLFTKKGQAKAREGQAYCKNVSFGLCPGLNSQNKVQLQECRATREAYNQSKLKHKLTVQHNIV